MSRILAPRHKGIGFSLRCNSQHDPVFLLHFNERGHIHLKSGHPPQVLSGIMPVHPYLCFTEDCITTQHDPFSLPRLRHHEVPGICCSLSRLNRETLHHPLTRYFYVLPPCYFCIRLFICLLKSRTKLPETIQGQNRFSNTS